MLHSSQTGKRAVQALGTKPTGTCCARTKCTLSMSRSAPRRLPILSTQALTHHAGRRGLLNLGQTCFMNVILQSFIANPLLRNWYLSDKHNSKLCKLKDCTSCEMDKLYSEVPHYRMVTRGSGLESEFSLNRSIPRIWRHMVPQTYWRRRGGSLPSCLGLPSKTPMSSSSPP